MEKIRWVNRVTSEELMQKAQENRSKVSCVQCSIMNSGPW